MKRRRDSNEGFEESRESVNQSPNADSHGNDDSFQDDDGKLSGYSHIDQTHLDYCLKNNSLISGFFEIMQNGISRGRCYLPERFLIAIFDKAAESWGHTNNIKEIYKLLSLDLKFRPAGNPKHSLIEETMIRTLHELKTKVINDSLSCLSSFPEFISLQLNFHYLVEALLVIQNEEVRPKSSYTPYRFVKLLNTPTLKCLTSLLAIVNEHISDSPSVPPKAVTDLHEDIQTVLCLPVEHCFNSVIKVDINEIVFCLVEELNQMKTAKLRMSLLQLLPSHLLLEKTIDLHLEREFCFHSSADYFINTFLYQDSESSLCKFCCVHLCRIPYKFNGELGDIAYFLFLLCSLFKELLLKEMASFLDGARDEDAVSEFQAILGSVQSHVPNFVDRLMEDERITKELVQSQCWMYLQLLSSLVEILQQTSTGNYF